MAQPPSSSRRRSPGCGRVARRAFLADMGMGLTGIALGSLLAQDGIARAASTHDPPNGLPHFTARAKSVIWFFLLGGFSHLESFDPKPAVSRYGGMTIDESPYARQVLESRYYRRNVRDFAGTPRDLMSTLFPMQVGFHKRGESGLEISDWFPTIGDSADELAIIRSMWTTDNDHAAQLQFHTGRHVFDGFFPSIGSWVHYGLGSLNDNLPQFLVMGPPPGDCCGGVGAHGADYLGPEHAGVRLEADPARPLPYATPGDDVSFEERRSQLELLDTLHELSAVEYPEDAATRARVKSYELAFRMQMAVPEALRIDDETESTRRLYALDQPACREFGQQCLVARRLVERGVRFVQIYDGDWDAHSRLKDNHAANAARVDRPIGGLLKDLRRRGLLDETLVVFATEFGRTPGAEQSDGRDHHPYGFSVWMAGGGLRGGVAHGATDELGFHAVEHRHYVTDLHATLLRQMGLDPRRLEIPGRNRLEIDFGEPIWPIIG